jgi:hypothetical protein
VASQAKEAASQGPAVAAQGNPEIAPINAKITTVKSYAELGAEWWQWALGTPVSTHPLLGNGPCTVGQRGHVWFLGGTFGLNAPVERTCTVPNGTALFFPLINAFYGAFLNDPPETRTEEYMRAQVACEVPTVLKAEIDGVAVKNPFQYFEMSPLFDVQLPEDNVFGAGPDVIPELLLSPSVDQGYYLFLNPLSPGSHTIHWEAAWVCPFGSFTENVTYTLTVRPGRKGD